MNINLVKCRDWIEGLHLYSFFTWRQMRFQIKFGQFNKCFTNNKRKIHPEFRMNFDINGIQKRISMQQLCFNLRTTKKNSFVTDFHIIGLIFRKQNKIKKTHRNSTLNWRWNDCLVSHLFAIELHTMY